MLMKGLEKLPQGILVAVMTFVMTPNTCITGIIDLTKDTVGCLCAALPLLVFIDGLCLTPRELPSEELPSEELPSEEPPTEELPSGELPTEELPSEELPLADPTL